MFKEERIRSYRGIALCVVIFIIGRILVDFISIRENPVLGNTFYIVAGNLLMAVSIIAIGLIIRHLYRLRKKEKKRKSGSKVVFLEDEKKRHHASRHTT